MCVCVCVCVCACLTMCVCTHQITHKLSLMKLKVISHCLLLDHMTQGCQILHSDLRELTGLECCFIDEEMCPGCQLEGPCHQPVGGVVLTRSELPAVHDRETKRQHDTLLDRDEE